MIELTHTIRVRALQRGSHIQVTIWSGPRGQTQAQNGQLTFTVMEWRHFRRHLHYAQLLGPLFGDLTTHLQAQRATLTNVDGECHHCTAGTDEDHADDCPTLHIDDLIDRITETLPFARPRWMVIEEE